MGYVQHVIYDHALNPGRRACSQCTSNATESDLYTQKSGVYPNYTSRASRRRMSLRSGRSSTSTLVDSTITSSRSTTALFRSTLPPSSRTSYEAAFPSIWTSQYSLYSETALSSSIPSSRSLNACPEEPEKTELKEKLHKRARRALRSKIESFKTKRSSTRISSPSTEARSSRLSDKRKHIRLLRLEPPVKKGSLIVCRLERASLLGYGYPSYDALSYRWEDPSPLHKIILDGVSTPVSPTVLDTLKELRQENTHRFLWIDSLCIRQTDVAEKEKQIRLMPDIYRKSNQVIVWLGGKGKEVPGDVDISLSVIDMINRDIRNETSPEETMMEKMFNVDGTRKTAALTSDYSKLLYRTILPYFESEWFSRRWIVQEVALAPKGVCYRANHQTNLTDVLRAAAWFVYKFGDDDDQEQRNIRHAATIFRYADPEFAFYHNRKHTVTPWDQKLKRSSIQARFRFPTFSVLLMDLIDQDASEPRDKIYGLLSLTEWTSKGKEMPESLQPNYNRPVAEVYRGATREAIRSAGNLNVLECVSRHKALHNTNRLQGYGRDDLPCWCPQWDRPFSHDSDATGLGANFRADGGRPLDMAPLVSGISPSSLHLRGIFVDEVIRTSTVMRPDVLCCKPGILPQAQGHFWPTVVADENVRRRYLKEDEDESSLAIAFLKTLGAGADLKTEPQEEIFLAPNSDDWTWPRNHHDIFARMNKAAIEKSCRNRRFFITKSGYMGIGPKTMRTGNELVLLYGGKWPFLLFPTVNEYYYFVGPCYVNGIMHGEALKEHEKEGNVSRMFEIR